MMTEPEKPERNMYGCEPCPNCGSLFRWPSNPASKVDPNVIFCGDCSHREPITDENRPRIC